MSLKARLQDDIKSAMRAGEKERLVTLRLISAAIKQREVDERIELDDAQTLAVIEKMVKQRRESIQNPGRWSRRHGRGRCTHQGPPLRLIGRGCLCPVRLGHGRPHSPAIHR